MSVKKKKFPRANPPRQQERSPGAQSAGFRDAVTLEDAAWAARGINRRVRRDRKEAKAAARDAYLRALLPR
jgi:hypothetical protein